ncbi:acyl-CoA dehydrogenase family protein [Streptomyces sp. HK10]|uniref:acyl-CoA dehydrogenase family protein n=1 Tax=Streptomyces sp. HK10 TaxID=3373255 RepID=UPI00374A7DB5
MNVGKMTSLAGELEDYLGDPHDDRSRMPFARILEHDEREQYPHQMVSLLQDWGLHHYCLPERWGGRAGDVEVGFQLVRLVARRDPTTATALMITNVAFMPTWIAATDEQGRAAVDAINHGGRMAWGLTERDHGSDILANEMRAEKVPGGYVLTGEKWLIGNATVADVVSVQARTDPRGGPGGWSVFAVDKRRCPAGSVMPLPAERLHGLRAIDMSGIRLDGVFVPEECRIGAEGQGLELALQGAQVARTVICAIALGAVDTALRVTLDFAEQRRIFGRKVADIPYSRRQLAESFADLMLADAVSAAAVRSLQVVPEQTSVFSSVVKYFVPTLLDRTMAQLSVVLGARQYLRDHPHYGVYQKMLRDLLAVHFVDGNTVVNLKSVGAQLDGLLTAAVSSDRAARDEAADRVSAVYDADAPLPVWEPHRQLLVSRGRDDTVVSLPVAVERLRAMAARHGDERQREWLGRAADLAVRLSGEFARLRAELDLLKRAQGRGYGSSAELFRLAERYCALHAAAASVQLAAGSARVFGEGFPDGAVLLLSLERVWRLLHPTETVTDPEVVDRVMEVLRALHTEPRLFSARPVPVRASAPASE